VAWLSILRGTFSKILETQLMPNSETERREKREENGEKQERGVGEKEKNRGRGSSLGTGR